MVDIKKYLYVILFVIILNFIFRILQIVFFYDINFIIDSLYTSLFKLILITIILYFLINKRKVSLKKEIIHLFKFSLIIVLINIYLSYKFLNNYDIYNLLFHFIRSFSVAFFEELVFRYLMFYLIVFYLKKVNNDCLYVYKSIIYSSIIFSFLHFSNFIFDRYDILSTILQMEIALIFGIFLQTIFIKYQSIILVAIIHCFINYYGSINRVINGKELRTMPEEDFLDFNLFLQNQIILFPLIVISFYISYVFSKKQLNINSLLK